MRKIIYAVLCVSIVLAVTTITRAAAVVDRTFGTNGTSAIAVGSSPKAKKIQIQADGKIIILGMVGSGSAANLGMVRCNANGSLDTGFGKNGVVVISFSDTSETINDIALQNDGKIIVVGNRYSTVTQSVDFLVARFNTNGILDTAFGADGVTTINQSGIDTFNAVAVQQDDKIIAVGTTSQNGYDFAAMRFTKNGTLDTSFADSGLYFLDLGPFDNSQQFRAVRILPTGRVLMAGSSLSGGGAADVFVMLEPSGRGALNFGTNGITSEHLGPESPGSAYDLAILPAGKFLSVSRSGLRRYLSNGEIDQSFRALFTTGGADITSAGTDIAVRDDGRVIVLNQSRGVPQDTVVYNNDGREINRAKGLFGADVAINGANKFLIAGETANGFAVTSFVSITSAANRIADLDFDGKTDAIVSRFGSIVYALRSSEGVAAYRLNRSSGEGVKIMPEDYYSNDQSQFPLFYWRYSASIGQAYFDSVTENGISSSYQWGLPTDIPIGGDYDGETHVSNSLFRKSTELAIFRPSSGLWWIFNRDTNTVSFFPWGMAGDKPVPADYDYDGITDFAIYRPSTGYWWIRRSSDGGIAASQFGIASDIPLTGDFDGDGKADQTVYRPSEGIWYQKLTTDGFRAQRFGLSSDIPVPGDYDGDGRHDIAVFRNGNWYVMQSYLGFSAFQWGNAADMPISVRYDD